MNTETKVEKWALHRDPETNRKTCFVQSESGRLISSGVTGPEALAIANARENAERVETLKDGSAPMADSTGEMTAAEEVLVWLLIEKLGCVDDETYSPDDAQSIICARLDENAKRVKELEARNLETAMERDHEFFEKKDAVAAMERQIAIVSQQAARIEALEAIAGPLIAADDMWTDYGSGFRIHFSFKVGASDDVVARLIGARATLTNKGEGNG